MVILRLLNRVRRIETIDQPPSTLLYGFFGWGKLKASAKTGSDQTLHGGLDFDTVLSSTKGASGERRKGNSDNRRCVDNKKIIDNIEPRDDRNPR